MFKTGDEVIVTGNGDYYNHGTVHYYSIGTVAIVMGVLVDGCIVRSIKAKSGSQLIDNEHLRLNKVDNRSFANLLDASY